MWNITLLAAWIAAAVLLLLGLGGVLGFALRSLLGRPLRPAQVAPGLWRSGWGDGVYYAFQYIRCWSLLMLLGSILGVALYLPLGELFVPGGDLALRLSKGLTNGFFYVGVVWGTGISLVWCFVHAHRLWRQHPVASVPTAGKKEERSSCQG